MLERNLIVIVYDGRRLLSTGCSSIAFLWSYIVFVWFFIAIACKIVYLSHNLSQEVSKCLVWRLRHFTRPAVFECIGIFWLVLQRVVYIFRLNIAIH